MEANKGRRVVIDVWPTLSTAFDAYPSIAWPRERGKAYGPLLAYFLWEGADKDEFWLKEIKRAFKAINQVALDEGCTEKSAPIYLNTSLESTSAKEIYGSNLKKLSKVREKYDLKNVMGRTGGFKIPLPKPRGTGNRSAEPMTRGDVIEPMAQNFAEPSDELEDDDVDISEGEDSDDVSDLN